MNRTEGKEFKETYFRYYDIRPVEREDIKMLDRLVRAKHIEYSVKDGKAYAGATEESKKLHNVRPSAPNV